LSADKNHVSAFKHYLVVPEAESNANHALVTSMTIMFLSAVVLNSS